MGAICTPSTGAAGHFPEVSGFSPPGSMRQAREPSSCPTCRSSSGPSSTARRSFDRSGPGKAKPSPSIQGRRPRTGFSLSNDGTVCRESPASRMQERVTDVEDPRYNSWSCVGYETWPTSYLPVHTPHSARLVYIHTGHGHHGNGAPSVPRAAQRRPSIKQSNWGWGPTLTFHNRQPVSTVRRFRHGQFHFWTPSPTPARLCRELSTPTASLCTPGTGPDTRAVGFLRLALCSG